MKNLSIIVPVYNKENMLEESLRSLLTTIDENVEFILIDDKSTDNSLSIAEDMASRDKRIKLLRNKINSGVSYTRNKGIKEAMGKYIGFFDADDIVDYGFYQKLYETAMTRRKQPDIVVGGFQCIFNEGLEISMPCINLLIESVPFSLQRKKFITKETVSCCNKIYHHEFLEGKYFPDYIKEDVYFHCWTMKEAKKIAERRDTSYYYSPKKDGRNQSYYSRPNGDFYDLVEGHEWIRRKTGNDEGVLDFLSKKQVDTFLEYLDSIINWQINEWEKTNLIGTMMDYCLLKYKMDYLSKINNHGLIKYYDIYKSRQNNKEMIVEQLERNMLMKSYQYPRTRK